jgi:hypothetical protein
MSPLFLPNRCSCLRFQTPYQHNIVSLIFKQRVKKGRLTVLYLKGSTLCLELINQKSCTEKKFMGSGKECQTVMGEIFYQDGEELAAKGFAINSAF